MGFSLAYVVWGLVFCLLTRPGLSNVDKELKHTLGKTSEKEPHQWPSNGHADTSNIQNDVPASVTNTRSVPTNYLKPMTRINTLQRFLPTRNHPQVAKIRSFPSQNTKQFAPTATNLQSHVGSASVFGHQPETARIPVNSLHDRMAHYQPQISHANPQGNQPTANFQHLSSPAYMHESSASVNQERVASSPRLRNEARANTLNKNQLANTSPNHEVVVDELYRPRTLKRGQCPHVICDEREMDIAKLVSKTIKCCVRLLF